MNRLGFLCMGWVVNERVGLLMNGLGCYDERVGLLVNGLGCW